MKKSLAIYAALFTLAITTACHNFQLPNIHVCSDGFETGNLLFVTDTAGNEGYCHIGITECADSVSFVYELNPRHELVRIPFKEFANEWYHKFDTNYAFPGYVHFFYIDTIFDTTALLNNLSKHLDFPADSTNELSLLLDCFLTPDGKPVFNINDTTLTALAKSPFLCHFKIQ